MIALAALVRAPGVEHRAHLHGGRALDRDAVQRLQRAIEQASRSARTRMAL